MKKASDITPMTIELKNIKVHERLSQETTCFDADLYIDGEKVGMAFNRGTGGATSYSPNDSEYVAAIRLAETYCKSLPPVIDHFDGEEYTIVMSLEYYIDTLVDAHLAEKAKTAMQKKMLTHVLVGVPEDSSQYGCYNFKATLESFLQSESGKTKLIASLNRIADKLNPGEKILNTNIPVELIPEKARLETPVK